MDSFLEWISAGRRRAGIIRSHPRARRLGWIIQLGIACCFLRRRTLRAGLVHGLRAPLVARLFFAALVANDAMVGVRHCCASRFHLSRDAYAPQRQWFRRVSGLAKWGRMRLAARMLHD